MSQYLTPEMAQKLADIAYAPQENDSLQRQVEQAISLRGGQQVQRLSPEAAKYEGIGDVARQIGSFAQETGLRSQQRDLLGRQKQGLGEAIPYMEMLRQQAQAEALRGAQQLQPQAQQQVWTPGMAMSGMPVGGT